ncbi:uncharacterized protein LOC107860940 isoform X2 [Capsicum annuum]|uniref:uncharacterized protein LOC107860940 isoform X2 n=1 Tax=Capsicum annuum TaxID=4072 RepID=UPI0007BF37A7|nr:uncharacterized protein LOC107860940 isoform X2 [Capsicum annuum]
MASPTVNYPSIIMPSRKCWMINQKLSQVRAQSNKDEEKNGKRSWRADVRVLRERIEEVKTKERLEKSLACKQGWNYYSTTRASYDKNQKRKIDYLSQSVEFFGMVCGTFSCTILGCTLCLYLTSTIIHLNP